MVLAPPLHFRTFESVESCVCGWVSIVALLVNVQAWHRMHIRVYRSLYPFAIPCAKSVSMCSTPCEGVSWDSLLSLASFASCSRNSSLHLIPNFTTMSTLHTAQIASGGWLRCRQSNRRCFEINRFLITQGEAKNRWVRLLVCFSCEK